MSPMPPATEPFEPSEPRNEAEIAAALDRLASSPVMQSNCMFQLALMVARIAAEPCAEAFKAEAAQALMDLIRAKPKAKVVRLFGGGPAAPAAAPEGRSTVVQFAAR